MAAMFKNFSGFPSKMVLKTLKKVKINIVNDDCCYHLLRPTLVYQTLKKWQENNWFVLELYFHAQKYQREAFLSFNGFDELTCYKSRYCYKKFEIEI